MTNNNKQVTVTFEFMLGLIHATTEKCQVVCEGILLYEHLSGTMGVVDMGNGWGDFLMTLSVVFFSAFLGGFSVCDVCSSVGKWTGLKSFRKKNKNDSVHTRQRAKVRRKRKKARFKAYLHGLQEDF